MCHSVSLYPILFFFWCVMFFIWQLCHCLLPFDFNGIPHLHQRESLMCPLGTLTVSDCPEEEERIGGQRLYVTRRPLSINRRMRGCPSHRHSQGIYSIYLLPSLSRVISSKPHQKVKGDVAVVSHRSPL